MALNTPVDREFAVLPRGHIRDKVILANFREGLRALVNPETGNPFTDDEIQRATQPGSRWYVAAQAIDDFGQSDQRRALWMADQIRLERASTKWLEDFHARLWGAEKLDATGGSGPVTVSGVPGTIVLGSTTLGAAGAYTARDPAGNVYQVFVGGTIDGDGTIGLTLQALGTGVGTNPNQGTLLTWVTRDPNMTATAVVAQKFTGGTPRETDGEQASRIAGMVRHRPGGGNDAHVRAWARAALNSIEDGFVYACAFFAGSTLVAIMQKRGDALGPTKRQPNAVTLATAISYLTPPVSPVSRPGFWVVTGWTGEYSDLGIRLGVPKGSDTGWLDSKPFPSYHAYTPRISSITSQTDFVVTALGDSTLPGQVSGAALESPAPRLMVWHRDTSRFEALNVRKITDLTGNAYRVELNAPPATLYVDDRISPAMHESRALVVGKALEAYFDELGPGELFDLANDSRGGRCMRFPNASEEKPFRAGAIVATRVIEALGGSAADALLADISRTSPSYPSNLMNGPNMLVCGHVGVYDLS